MRTYPTSTANMNVPTNAFLLAEVSTMSGEIVTTYYATEDGSLYKVTDWVGNKPQPISLKQACDITGDWPAMILSRMRGYYF